MNKANLKSYAPKARLDFIKAVTERANVLASRPSVWCRPKCGATWP
jgi:hypothetical protein